jgi:hypothetical protein
MQSSGSWYGHVRFADSSVVDREVSTERWNSPNPGARLLRKSLSHACQAYLYANTQ